MIVSAELYERMTSLLNDIIRSNGKVTPAQAADLQVEYDALISLYSQLFIRNLKVETRGVHEGVISKILKRSQRGESLLALADEFHFGSYKFAKIYLDGIGEGNLQLQSIVSDPMLIKDPKIRRELLQLIADDPVCSHELEQVKECLGREYEELLINLLNQRNMCFETEADLRSRGKPKTPDILFQIPMATACTYRDVLHKREQYTQPQTPTAAYVTNSSGNVNPTGSSTDATSAPSHSVHATAPLLNDPHPTAKVVINWIDSKAMFADAATFKENLDQFRAYNSRYGRGMVIYWHGYLEGLADALPDDMIVVRDCFPEEWMFPTGERADGRMPAFDQVGLL